VKKSEVFAGERMYQEEIQKALKGEKFFIFGLSGEKEYLPPINEKEFKYYLGVYKKIKHFGLPHGKGWIFEQSWYLDFYIEFHEAYKETLDAIKYDAIERENRKLKADKGKKCQR